MLEMEGYRAIPASNGKLGVQIAILEIPDFIICNMRMPYLNGYQVLKILRAFSTTRRIPFLFLSTDVLRSSILKALILGANYYLTKPFSMMELLRILKRHEAYYSQD
jgi:DNA-binding response OmpR family regulator